jgi:hypothetical protein
MSRPDQDAQMKKAEAMPPRKRGRGTAQLAAVLGGGIPSASRMGHPSPPGRQDVADTQKILLPTGCPPDFSGNILTPLAAQLPDHLAGAGGHRFARSVRGLKRSTWTTAPAASPKITIPTVPLARVSS